MIRCPRCQSSNRSDSRFCTLCGVPLTPSANAAPPVKSKNSPLMIGAIILGVLFSCGICGLIGKLGDDPRNSASVETASVKNTTALSQTPVTSASAEPSINEAPRTLAAKPADKSKTALVITDDAGMLDAPKSDAKVIRRLSEGENIKVIKQKGAWFYVSTGEQEGWMHGDAIRYETLVRDIKVEKTAPPVRTPNATYAENLKASRRTPEPEINNSGATAKCRDGSLSYSQHRRGTCSHHGGVAVWY